MRYELERVPGKAIGVPIRRVRDGGAAVGRRLFDREEIGGEMQIEMIIANDIAANDSVTAIARHPGTGAAPGGGFPNRQRQGFGALQRLDHKRGVRMSTNLARVIETSPGPGDRLC